MSKYKNFVKDMEKHNIMKLENIKTFWEDVKNIVGYYEGVDYKDYEIKELQRIADYRYSQLELENK